MTAYLGEFLGTMLLVLLGDGVCANVNLNKSNFKNGGLVIVTIGWGMAVLLPAACFSNIWAASYNPALTIALCIGGSLPWSQCIGYIIAEMVGGIIGGILVWIAFKPQFDATADEPGTMLGVFCTAPGVRNIPYNILQEAFATFWLVFAILAFPNCGVVDGGVSKFFVFAIIVSCGMSFGGLTGYAMNPARDIGPRIAHAILPIKGKGSSDWGYAIVPILGPIIGAIVAVLLYMVIPW